MQHPQQVVSSSSAELLQNALQSLQAQQLLAQNNQLVKALCDNLEPLEQRQFNEEHEKNRKESISGQNQGQFSMHSQIIDEKAGVPSKKCNCRQSQCIKLYCECYAAGAYCNGCHCVGCKNNDQSEGWRNKAIQNTLVKNPQAFLPKISQKQEPSKEVDPLNLGKHNKGCACKKSGCMKKYCECFQAGVPCSDNCKCSACQNVGFLSHGNLLRQFREEEGYPQQNQILHKFLLAHNEDHLNTILGDQIGEGEQKRGIPIKQEFIEESCMKLLQILHLPEEQILLQREQQNAMEVENSSVAEGTRPQKANSISIGQTTQTRMKTPEKPETDPHKSNQNSSCDDIDMACQDEKMDEEEDQNEDQRVNQLKSTGKCEEDQQIQGEENETHEKEQAKGQAGENNEFDSKNQEEVQNNNINNNEVEEHHSSEVTRRQQLFELRRTMILDTFLQLLRTVENSIAGQ